MVDTEFPLLQAQGLYAADITGDGNCLFRALADQLYNDSTRHMHVRREVVGFLRQHKDQFIAFLPAMNSDSSTIDSPGAMSRKMRRRRAAASAASREMRKGGQTSTRSRTRGLPVQISGQLWESYLDNMSCSGVYGDNLEIVAFAKRFKVDVKVHLADFDYVVSGRHSSTLKNINSENNSDFNSNDDDNDDDGAEDEDQVKNRSRHDSSSPNIMSDDSENFGRSTGDDIQHSSRPLLHIAYHDWEHYSSVRPLNPRGHEIPRKLRRKAPTKHDKKLQKNKK
ncbi:uncharacterized protein V1516DRAFT_680340 [Lipomyces oligophaga]|uniref:uncharacterized protein n=1 Tax=Lipomyces oligophaga TaxID=45792 RepID=UPI0034CD461C